MATSLVSLTEAALMKPPGGSLTCVGMSVSQLEHKGQSIPLWFHYDQGLF